MCERERERPHVDKSELHHTRQPLGSKVASVVDSLLCDPHLHILFHKPLSSLPLSLSIYKSFITLTQYINVVLIITQTES